MSERIRARDIPRGQYIQFNIKDGFTVKSVEHALVEDVRVDPAGGTVRVRTDVGDFAFDADGVLVRDGHYLELPGRTMWLFKSHTPRIKDTGNPGLQETALLLRARPAEARLQALLASQGPCVRGEEHTWRLYAWDNDFVVWECAHCDALCRVDCPERHRNTVFDPSRGNFVCPGCGSRR